MKSVSIIIAAAAEETRNILSAMCAEADISDISVTDGRNIRGLFTKHSYDIALLVLPLGEQFGADTAAYLDRSYDTRVVALVPSKAHEDACSKLSGTGALILPRSSSKAQIVNVLRSERCIAEKLADIKDEKATMLEMVNETKLVNRAKCVLIEYLRISEKEAHRQMQKRAMDQRVTLSDVAQDILKTYDYNR